METKSYKVCCFFTRKFKAIDGDVASYVMEAFEKYTDGGIRMNVYQLGRFIEDSRGDVVSFEDAERILDDILLKRYEHFTISKTLSYEDFYSYVLSDDQLNPPIKSQDMNLPLSHYFIYTSHNSYLTGNQISSDCSDVPIINALKRGVRVIKLDLWPNSSKDNVEVLNGRTLTTPVELMKCLNSIKEHAFTTSPYPVIIILEDHLTPGLQAKVAQLVTDTFGEMLFCHKLSKLKELPSPESLKHRILVSAEDKYESDESDNDHDTEDYDIKISDSCTAYKNLIAIYAAKPKGGVVEAMKIEKDEMKHLSLSEQEFEEAAEHHQHEIVRFTHKNILRMYPKHSRITSSDYNPLVGWLHGAQMIAFNMEGYGRWLWLMHGMFRANGVCGYVKKPDFLITSGPNNEVFNPKAKLPVKTTLKVKIYMGDGWHLDFKKNHFSAFSPPDFYTMVSIYGANADEIMKKTMVKKNTWAPVWNEEFEFSLKLPEIALLLIEVHEYNKSEKNNFAGQTCLPVSELMSGIHVVPLHNRKGHPFTGARLLIRFQFVSN